MKPSLKNSSVLALFLLAVVATSQEAAQRVRPGASARPAAPAAKGPLRTRAGADACPGTLITILPFSDSGDTTGTTNNVNTVNCAAAIPNAPSDQGPDLTYSFTILGPVNNLTITVTPTAPYDTSIYVLSTCDVGTTCVAYADTFGCPPPCNPPETITLTNLAPGTYHLYIDSFFSTVPGNPQFFPAGAQGPYTLSVTGNLGIAPTPTVTPTPTPTSTGTVTPTPVFTATNTPTASPTITSTPVPTSTLTPTPAGQGGPGAGPATPIPTLSGWMLAAFAAALVAVALFLTRRS